MARPTTEHLQLLMEPEDGYCTLHHPVHCTPHVACAPLAHCAHTADTPHNAKIPSKHKYNANGQWVTDHIMQRSRGPRVDTTPCTRCMDT